MKSMACIQLGGACNLQFFGNEFEELASQSKKHGRDMYELGDPAHLEAMENMMSLVQAGHFDDWLATRKSEFDQL